MQPPHAQPEPETLYSVRERLTRQDVEKALKSGESLSFKDLSGLNLSNLRFENIDLSGSDLSRTENVNTLYRSSRAAGANFSGAMFRDSTIQRVYAFESKWDGAQFEQTNILGNNFARASFHNAVFRDQARTVNQEQSPAPPGQKQQPSAESPDQRGSNQAGSEPSDERAPDGSSRKPWTQRL